MLRGKDARRITIGARAASKLLVEVVHPDVIARSIGATLLLVSLRHGGGLLLRAGRRRQRRHAGDSSRTWEITDNSFLVEEAFNQEAGVVQNIFTLDARRETAAGPRNFTQEWPAPGMRASALVLARVAERRRGDAASATCC